MPQTFNSLVIFFNLNSHTSQQSRKMRRKNHKLQFIRKLGLLLSENFGLPQGFIEISSQMRTTHSVNCDLASTNYGRNEKRP